jgi:ferredoxin
MGQLRVTVNPLKCQSYKRCTAIAPTVFAIGVDDKAKAEDADSVPRSEVVKAARSCPYRAITVVVEESGEQLFPPQPGVPAK